jgi:ATP-dependent DNA helicase RecQ
MNEYGDPLEILHRVFGHTGFRGLQEEVVRHAVGGGSGLVLMPTGGGKSLCFQIPALCRPGLGVVVSPLIALMEDQVAALRQQDIKAAALHSELPPEEARAVWRDLNNGDLKLLYVSPERLTAEGTLSRLDELRIALFAIDEAHCVSQWGHHFRPEYRALPVLASRFPSVPRLALTATADTRTVVDIQRQLALESSPLFRASFDRPNILISALPREQERAQLRRFIKGASDGTGAGLIYCGTRKKAEQTADWLKQDGLDGLVYHAGMESSAKRDAHRRFARGDAVVMAATIAFGMGIDRPDVRYVAHTDLPKSPESWYQEIGRSGRDGLPAQALLLYGAGDISLARHRIGESGATDEQKRVERQRLEAMVGIAEAATCRRQILLRCFGEDVPEACGACDICLHPPKLFDGTVPAQKLLSAVLRTGRRFGLGHVVDVLQGKVTEKVAQFGHDQLPTFGVGRDLSENVWRGIARQLVAQGALDVVVENHGELVPTEAARPILKGEQSVMLREELITIPARGSLRTRSNVESPSDPRFAALREWRKRTALAQGVPAYVIFQDRTLAEIVAEQPETLDHLGTISGVGTTKLERYGQDVLRVLRDHAA